MLENSFQPFYVVGMQLQWNILDWNASKKKRESLQLSRELITTEEAVFNLTMQRALSEQSIELEKLKQLIEADLALVELRKEVVISAASQMQNGVITTSAYLVDLNKLYESENQLSMHKLQFLLVQANYSLTKGI